MTEWTTHDLNPRGVRIAYMYKPAGATHQSQTSPILAVRMAVSRPSKSRPFCAPSGAHTEQPQSAKDY